MFIELHVIQNFAPSNLNRDDTNNPKDCEFGGVRRARISSQCIKRAIRTCPIFAQTTTVETGIRTRWLTRPLCQALQNAGKPETEAKTAAETFAAAYAGKMDKAQSERTSVLLYLSAEELQSIVDALLGHWEAITNPEVKDSEKETLLENIVKDIIKQTRERTSAPDIALFGRMLADKPELSLDAACQVAHAISTHRVTMEMDFFTAVDDLQQEEETGAGMMGFTGFNSATFYRYSRIDWDQLTKNLTGEVDLARRTVEGFLRSTIYAIPTGKQTSFAAQNPPSMLMTVVRTDGMGWSLANAFEKPVRAKTDSGYIAPSIEALDAYWGRLSQVYGTDTLRSVATLALDPELPLTNLDSTRLPDAESWVKATLEALPKE